MLSFFRNTKKELEKARAKLILDLQNGDIDFLIKQMMSGDIYSPLLNKKRKTETSNTDGISWYAYRHAETLSLPTHKDQLLKKLDIENEPAVRSEIYFCLSHLCKNTSDKELFNFLMDKLEAEDDESKLHILIGVREMNKDADLNIDPIKKLTKSKSRDLKVNSILALKYTHDDQVEDLLLKLFDDTKDSHRKGMICSTLRTIGTAKSVPILQLAFKKTRDFGLRSDITDTINKINEQDLT